MKKDELLTTETDEATNTTEISENSATADRESIVKPDEDSHATADRENTVKPDEGSPATADRENTVKPDEGSPATAGGETPPAVTKTSRETGLGLYWQLCLPILLFPVLYFPYTMWWRRDFAAFATRIAHDSGSGFLRLMITGNNTILLFWCAVTVAVMLASVIMSIIRLRPWYLIPVYIAVMFSLCGILSLFFYTMIIR